MKKKPKKPVVMWACVNSNGTVKCVERTKRLAWFVAIAHMCRTENELVEMGFDVVKVEVRRVE
jgi:hypothetical protein